MDTWAQAGAPSAALFMAQAQLFGCWAVCQKLNLPLPSALFGLALTEPQSGGDWHSLKSQLTGKNRLKLQKTWVTNGSKAKGFLVSLNVGGKAEAYYIPRVKTMKLKPLPARWALRDVDGVSLNYSGPLPKGSLALGPAQPFLRMALHFERALIFASAPGLLENGLKIVEREAKKKRRGNQPLSSTPRFVASRKKILAITGEIRQAIEANATALDAGNLSFIQSAASKVRLHELSLEGARILLQISGKECLLDSSPIGEIFRDLWAGLFYSGPSDLLAEFSQPS